MLFYNLIICHVLKMDILKYLYEGRISEDQAYDIFDREVDAFHAGEFETSDDGTYIQNDVSCYYNDFGSCLVFSF